MYVFVGLSIVMTFHKWNLKCLCIRMSQSRVTIQINYNIKGRWHAPSRATHLSGAEIFPTALYTSPLELLSWQHIRVSLLCYQNVCLLIRWLFSGGKIRLKHVNNICPVNLLECLSFIIISQLLQKVMLAPWLTSLNPTLLSRGLLHLFVPSVLIARLSRRFPLACKGDLIHHSGFYRHVRDTERSTKTFTIAESLKGLTGMLSRSAGKFWHAKPFHCMDGLSGSHILATCSMFQYVWDL